MRTMQTNPTVGVKEYQQRMTQLKSYLPFTLFSSGKAQGLDMKEFDEMDKRENLANALAKIQEK